MIFKKFDGIYSTERDQTADLLKGFAVLMMIQVHLMELFAKPEITQNLLGKISLFLGGPPAAPIFMAVMGYFLSGSIKSFSQNLKRGLALIAGGIILNIGLNFHLLVLIYLGKIQVDPFRYIFGADILPLAGLSIILISGIKRISKNNFYANSIISILLIIFILILQSASVDFKIDNQILIFVQAFFFGNLEWSYFPFLPWAIYPLVGFLYKTIIEHFNINDSFRNVIASISGIITFTTIKYGINVASKLNAYYHHDWIYALWVFQFMILFTYGLHKIQIFYGKSSFLIYIKWLGKNVTSVYVFQWLIIGNTATLIYKTQTRAELLIWFIAVLILTTISVYYFEKYGNSQKIPAP
jgi:uncharacterized membrane protein